MRPKSIWLCFLFLLFSVITGLKGVAATITYTVAASGGSHTTIVNAYNACTTAADNYIIEIRTTGATPYAGETYPINITAKTNSGVIIRPEAGSSYTFQATGGEICVFRFFGGDNVTIDGRPGGAGTTKGFTIDNNQTGTRPAIIFTDNASDPSNTCTVKYCTLKSSTSNANTGVVHFTPSASNISTLTIDNCVIREAASGNPYSCIYAYDSGLGYNSTVTVNSCELINFTNYGIFLRNYLVWTVSGNSFYQTASQNPTWDMYGIYVHDGPCTITSNFFGGQAASCGGSAYTISSSQRFWWIYYNWSTAGAGATNNCRTNTFANMTYSTTYNGSPQFSFISTAGPGDFAIGGSGNANTFGATSGTGSVVINNNVNSLSAFAILFHLQATGTTTFTHNTMGAITVQGTNNTGPYNRLFHLTNNGTNTISNNTFGNTTSNNMSFAGTSSHYYGVFVNTNVTNTLTISSNTFRNHQLSSTAGSPIFIYSQGTALLTCSSNTFSNITSAEAYHRFILHHTLFGSTPAGATINSNTFSDINMTASDSYFDFIYCRDANTGNTVDYTINSNTVGSSTSNNIACAGANAVGNDVIYVQDARNITANSNTIQNFNLTSTSSSLVFWGIRVSTGLATGTGATISSNTIQNISNASTTSGSAAFVGIYGNGSYQYTVSQNTIDNLTFSNTGSSNTGGVSGMYFNSSASSSTNNITKNRITNLKNLTTSDGSGTVIYGIYNQAGATTWNYYNNVILIDNSGCTYNYIIYGMIMLNALQTNNIYHNTIKISGTVSNGTTGSNTYCLYVSTASGTYNVRNNIFQNVRTTSTSGGYYAVGNLNTSNTFNSNHNYMEVHSTMSSKLGRWGGTDRSWSTWQSIPKDANGKNSTITISSSGTVPNATSSDVYQTGTDLSSTVTDDIDGVARSTTPWMGAFENYHGLPVELTQFSGACNNGTIQLYWTTATETNNDYFSIQRSENGTDFTEIGTVNGSGTVSTSKLYQFTDYPENKNANYYYRLKQVDLDGKYKYLNTITAGCVNQINQAVVYPNPFIGDQLHVTYISDEEKTVSIQITDMLGNIISSHTFFITAGSNILQWEVQYLAPAMYFLNIQDDFGNSQSHKLNRL